MIKSKLTYILLLALSHIHFISAKPEKVRIYHTVNNQTALEGIKQNGLYSVIGFYRRPMLMLQNYKKLYPEMSYFQIAQRCTSLLAYYACQKLCKNVGFRDQLDVIYFKPEEPGAKDIANFAIEVDPNATYVYNLRHRIGVDFDEDLEGADKLYRQSRVVLSDYLKFLQEAKQMVEARPGIEVQLDPETARPFYLEENDPRKNQVKIDGQWAEYNGLGTNLYSGEVIIPRNHIPVDEIIMLQDQIGNWNDIKPVKNITQ